MGYICYPIAFFIGIPRADLRNAGELIGLKIITNEYVAFKALTTEAQYIAMSPRTQLITTYALCGKSFLQTRHMLVSMVPKNESSILIVGMIQALAIWAHWVCRLACSHNWRLAGPAMFRV